MIAEGQNATRQRLRVSPGLTGEVELSWFGLTDVGKRRENNQDSYVTVPPVFAVADGMGGHAGGEIASEAVASRLRELAENASVAGEVIEVSQAVTLETLNEALSKAVQDMALHTAEFEAGTGTTVSGLALGNDAEGPVWSVFNVGDSRVYQFFTGSLTQVTVDHSVVQHLIDTGQITEAEAEYHPHANVITRAVGAGEDPTPDFGRLACIPGQRMLICSDGLTKELTDIGLQHFLSISKTAEDAAKLLMQHALENAGRDNVTVVVIDVHAVGERTNENEAAISKGSSE